MKYSQVEAANILERIGVSRWDFLPPHEGKIKFYNKEDVKVGEGDYKLILSYGPEEKYTMAWDIAVYEPFPVVPKLNPDDPAIVQPALLDDAMVKAMEVGEAIGADFVYRAQTIYVAIFNFTEIDDGEPEVNLSVEERLRIMREDQARHESQ